MPLNARLINRFNKYNNKNQKCDMSISETIENHRN